MKETVTWLAGYDSKGEVYDDGEFIVRKMLPEYFDEIREIYNIYKSSDLSRYGIVETEKIFTDTPPNYLFRHRKHIISYPYEWTANMYKDAVLFHLNLFSTLDKFGLTLKDALPNNIVFDFNRPVFVDFISMVQKDKLRDEAWLVKGTKYTDPRFAVMDRMFIPFMLIPLLAMGKSDYALARRMLSEQACNCGMQEPKWGDLYSGFVPKFQQVMTFIKNRIKYLLGYNDSIKIEKIKSLIMVKDSLSFVDFNRRVIESIEGIDVTPPKSGYVAYYDEKKENFDFQNQTGWTNKQINICKIISESQPMRVLDIGANTGWFSILAESLGAEVISTDIDESSIDVLYLYAKENKLRILPLLMSFDGLTKEMYGIEDPCQVNKDRDFKSTPLFLPATERLKSDIVLCLGLMHHLILGEGKPIEKIFELLSELTRKTLILEFVNLDDNLIQKEPSFFKNMNSYDANNYNDYLILNEGKKHFRTFEILDSHPNTRKLIVFSK